MLLSTPTFTVTDWDDIEPTEHPGITGAATWRTQNFGDIRVRRVTYTPGILPIIGAAKGMCCCA